MENGGTGGQTKKIKKIKTGPGPVGQRLGREPSAASPIRLSIGSAVDWFDRVVTRLKARALDLK